MTRTKKQLALFFSALFLFSVLVAAYHYHAGEMRDHPNCVICKLAHDIVSTEKPSCQVVIKTPDPEKVTFVRDVPDSFQLFLQIRSNPRAPPA